MKLFIKINLLTWKVWLVKEVDLGKSFCLKQSPFESKISLIIILECKRELDDDDVMHMSWWWDDDNAYKDAMMLRWLISG